jgi:hypothetical protein
MWAQIVAAIANVFSGTIKNGQTEYSNRISRYHDSKNNGVLLSLIPIVIIVLVIFIVLAKSK